MKYRIPKKRIFWFFAGTIAVIIIISVISGYLIGYDRIARKLGLETELIIGEWASGERGFPEIDSTGFSEYQKRIVDLSMQEFIEQPAGTKYSEGASEAWCANFVSWIMNEADVPLKNPHTSSWRIPGTFTLKEYYEAEGRFKPVDSGYVPELGDVAIYRGSPVFGDHANIVLLNENGVMTTVGGNEGNRIRVYENNEMNYKGLLGYGVLN